MHQLFRFYRLLNILSLDVAIGAMVSAAFMASVMEVDVTWKGLTSLGLIVWLIYTADHLLDARRVKSIASTERHRFHQVHFHGILVSWFAVAAAVVVLLFYLRHSVLLWGAALSILVILYFLIQSRLSYLKEILGALLYSSGVLLPGLALSGFVPESRFVAPVGMFVLTAFTNLVLFSWFDQEHDRNDNHQSLVSRMGENVTSKLLYGLFVIQFILGAYLFINNQAEAATVMLVMNGILMMIFFLYPWFSVRDRYRLVGDAIFLIPLIHLLAR